MLASLARQEVGLGHGAAHAAVVLGRALEFAGIRSQAGQLQLDLLGAAQDRAGVLKGLARLVEHAAAAEVTAQLELAARLERRVQPGPGDEAVADVDGPLDLALGAVEIAQGQVDFDGFRVVADGL